MLSPWHSLERSFHPRPTDCLLSSITFLTTKLIIIFFHQTLCTPFLWPPQVTIPPFDYRCAEETYPSTDHILRDHVTNHAISPTSISTEMATSSSRYLRYILFAFLVCSLCSLLHHTMKPNHHLRALPSSSLSPLPQSLDPNSRVQDRSSRGRKRNGDRRRTKTKLRVQRTKARSRVSRTRARSRAPRNPWLLRWPVSPRCPTPSPVCLFPRPITLG